LHFILDVIYSAIISYPAILIVFHLRPEATTRILFRCILLTEPK